MTSEDDPVDANDSIWKAVRSATASLHRKLHEKETDFRRSSRNLKVRLCDAFVAMVQTSDFWKSNHSADGLYRSRIRRVSLQRKGEDVSDDNKKSTNAMYGAATLHSRQSMPEDFFDIHIPAT
jgi:hypothetical protein